MAKRKKKNIPVDFGSMDFISRVKFAAKAIFGYKESVPSALGIDRPEDRGFKRLTARSDKELKPADWQKQMSVAHFLWLQNPMAGRILELMADHVVGDGFGWEAKDDEVEKILERHWNDPDNAWDLLQFDRYQEFSLFGTFAPKPFVDKNNGHVKLSALDPAWIKDILPDKDISGKAAALKVLNPNSAKVGQATTETWKVIGIDTRQTILDKKTGEMVGNEHVGLLEGEVFYFTMNKLTFLLQGMSDLFRVADWLDAFDQYVFSLLERINFLNAHLYDITVEDAEQPEIDKILEELELNPPHPGGYRVHNQRMKWEALAPKINSAEVEQVARIIKMLILGAFGIPEHWFGEGGDVNKATAAEMGGPIYRKLKRKQAQWSEVLRTILQFQIDSAIRAGRLTKVFPKGSKDKDGKDISGQKRDLSFTIQAPEISAKDLKNFVDSLSSFTTTLANATAEGFIKRVKAAGLWTSVAEEFGIEIGAPDEAEVDQNLADEEESAVKGVADILAEPYKDLAAKANGNGNGNGPAAPADGSPAAPEAAAK